MHALIGKIYTSSQRNLCANPINLSHHIDHGELGRLESK